MLRLRDIMTRELVTVSPELSLRDTMELFVSERVTGAPVVAQSKVVGVVSTTDLLGFAAALPVPGASRADDDPWPESGSTSESASDEVSAASWFTESGADEAPDVVARFDENESKYRDRFAEHTVSEIMTNDIRWLPSYAPVDSAADFMRDAGIHRVLVMDNGELKGLVTMKDIADAVADHKLTTRTYVFGANIDYQARPAGDRRR